MHKFRCPTLDRRHEHRPPDLQPRLPIHPRQHHRRRRRLRQRCQASSIGPHGVRRPGRFGLGRPPPRPPLTPPRPPRVLDRLVVVSSLRHAGAAVAERIFRRFEEYGEDDDDVDNPGRRRRTSPPSAVQGTRQRGREDDLDVAGRRLLVRRAVRPP